MQKIAVLGAGESGVGAALLAKKNDIEVFVSDFGTIGEKFRQELKDNSISFEERGHNFEKLVNTDLIVKSPGIPDTAEIITKLRLRHKEIISEVEFAYRFYDGKIAAVTGSNGKTTTTSLLYHLLAGTDMKVGLGGNIGHSFARMISSNESYDWIVLELSSFQLDDIKSFSAEIAILLNISPDHLDRYDHTMYKYAFAKWKLAMNLSEKSHLILNKDDEWLSLMEAGFPVTARVHSLPYEGLEVSSLSITEIDFSVFQLKGQHNLFNATAAVKAALLAGASTKVVNERLGTFSALEHRLEPVGTIAGVEYINDSKATNIDSVLVALESMNKPVIWIAGGVDKGNDYSLLDELVRQKVKSIICLTKDDAKLQKAFASIVDMTTTEDTDDCVKIAMQTAEQGDVVLLSPACASFDLFGNYKDRGKAFKDAVRKIKLG